MSTPFLTNFSAAVVRQLVQRGLLEVAPGREEAVVAHLAAELFAAREGSQLIHTTARALLSAPDVEELYADDAELIELVQDLGPGAG